MKRGVEEILMKIDSDSNAALHAGVNGVWRRAVAVAPVLVLKRFPLGWKDRMHHT